MQIEDKFFILTVYFFIWQVYNNPHYAPHAGTGLYGKQIGVDAF